MTWRSLGLLVMGSWVMVDNEVITLVVTTVVCTWDEKKTGSSDLIEVPVALFSNLRPIYAIPLCCCSDDTRCRCRYENGFCYSFAFWRKSVARGPSHPHSYKIHMYSICGALLVLFTSSPLKFHSWPAMMSNLRWHSWIFVCPIISLYLALVRRDLCMYIHRPLLFL
jgi:hypothetical protein